MEPVLLPICGQDTLIFCKLEIQAAKLYLELGIFYTHARSRSLQGRNIQ